MLIHICCSVDSHFFLENIKRDFPDEKLTGFFYDPNIHPYSEYYLRFLDVQRSCDLLGIKLLEGEYDFENWLEAVKGFEDEPEKGKRCELCFDKRFHEASQKAIELDEKSFTTTLLVSPLKSQEQLKNAGEKFFQKSGIKFIAVDYKSGNGSSEQSRVTKENQLYRQDYCGCFYALSKQRFGQNIFLDEMICHIGKQIQPSSIEERIKLYEKRNLLEKSNILYKIVKEKFLNYRQLSAKVIKKNEVIDSYFFSYSTLKRKKSEGKIDFCIDGLHYFNRDEIRVITLEKFNEISEKKYTNVKEMIFNSPSIEDELHIKNMLLNESYSLSPIIVLDCIDDQKMTILLDAIVYEDTKEKLIINN